MLNITLNDFTSLLNMHWCDWDGVDGNQCFDLAQFWNKVLGGTPFSGATADLIYNQPQNIYTQIPNTPINYPEAGDIVVFNFPHVGIATGNNTDANQFEVLEQNDPTNGSCQLKTYNYNGVIGWLRPNALPQSLQDQLNQCDSDRDNNWNIVVSVCSRLGVEIDPNNKPTMQQSAIDAITQLDTALGAAQKESSDRQSAINKLNQKIILLNQTIEQDTTEDHDMGIKIINLEHTINSIISALNLPASASSDQILTAIQNIPTQKAKLPSSFWERIKLLFL